MQYSSNSHAELQHGILTSWNISCFRGNMVTTRREYLQISVHVKYKCVLQSSHEEPLFVSVCKAAGSALGLRGVIAINDSHQIVQHVHTHSRPYSLLVVQKLVINHRIMGQATITHCEQHS